MKCCVTGATGFVGGHLCERLCAEGHEVVALARRRSRKKILQRCGAEIVIGDLDTTNVFAENAGNADVVFHLAAITKALRSNDFFTVNTIGTRNVIRGLRRAAFGGRVVYLSSLAAGGPVRDRRSRRREDDEDEPVSDYGESKLAAEDILKQQLPESCSWTILRPGAIYGPREHEIYEVLKVMKRTGLAFRLGQGIYSQMTHVEDVVDGLLLAATKPQAAGRTYNLTDDPLLSFDDIMRMASVALGRRTVTVPVPLFLGRLLAGMFDRASRLRGKSLSPLTSDKLLELQARFWAADSTRAKTELGWRARRDFQGGLEETIDWYRRKGWL